MSEKIGPIDLSKVMVGDVLHMRNPSFPTFTVEKIICGSGVFPFNFGGAGWFAKDGRIDPFVVEGLDFVKVYRNNAIIMREPLLKPWLLKTCSALDYLAEQFLELNDKADDDGESYSQKEYLLQELEHLRDAVSETTEDDLEVE